MPEDLSLALPELFDDIFKIAYGQLGYELHGRKGDAAERWQPPDELATAWFARVGGDVVEQHGCTRRDRDQQRWLSSKQASVGAHQLL